MGTLARVPAAGDWLSGRAPRSHRGGHWFDPSIAHPAQRPVPFAGIGRFWSRTTLKYSHACGMSAAGRLIPIPVCGPGRCRTRRIRQWLAAAASALARARYSVGAVEVPADFPARERAAGLTDRRAERGVLDRRGQA